MTDDGDGEAPKKGKSRPGSMPARWINSRQMQSKLNERINTLYDEAMEINSKLDNPIEIGDKPVIATQTEVERGYVKRNKSLDRGKGGQWKEEMKERGKEMVESLKSTVASLKELLSDQEDARLRLYAQARDLALQLGEDPPPEDASTKDYEALIFQLTGTKNKRYDQSRKKFDEWLKEVDKDSDPVPPDSFGELTESQSSVVSHVGKAPLLVCACAGSGKTHTLIHKICDLIKERGINSRGIWVLSFTNSAVNEIRRRLAHTFADEGLEEDVFSVRIMTLDSFASKVNFNYTGKYIAGSYEENVKSAVERLEEGFFEDSGIVPTHVLVDEAQDLEQPRVEELVKLMQVLKDSQFTVFFDRHQAIYGWSVKTEEHDDVDGGREFLERLHEQCLLSRGCEPKVVRLEPILFRAGNPEMQDLHIRARRIIRKSATDPQEAGEELSELIKEAEA